MVIVNPAAPVGPRDIKPTPTGRMIVDAAAGRMPAFLDTGLNVVHVDDVAEGHMLALERGVVGERYILGGENLTLAALLALVDEVVGPHAAACAPVRARCSGRWRWRARGWRGLGMEPLVTRDHLRMARKKMFFSSDKARAELGFSRRARRARRCRTRCAWFRANGMLKRVIAARVPRSSLAWAYLLALHGRFWLSGPELIRRPARRDAAGRGRGARARRGGRASGPRCAPCSRRTTPGRSGSCWWTTAAPTAPARSRARIGDDAADAC